MTAQELYHLDDLSPSSPDPMQDSKLHSDKADAHVYTEVDLHPSAEYEPSLYDGTQRKMEQRHMQVAI
jgi:hypothetical protein